MIEATGRDAANPCPFGNPALRLPRLIRGFVPPSRDGFTFFRRQVLMAGGAGARGVPRPGIQTDRAESSAGEHLQELVIRISLDGRPDDTN